MNGAEIEVLPSPQQASPNTETEHMNYMRTRSLPLGPNNHVKLTNPVQDFFHRVRSGNYDRSGKTVKSSSSSESIREPSTPQSSSDESDGLPRRSLSPGLVLSTCSSNGGVAIVSISIVNTEVRENGLMSGTLLHSDEDIDNLSPPSVLVCAIVLG